MPRIIVIEPFYGGSHKQLIDFLQTLTDNIELVTLPAKKWHWRARTSALHFSQIIPENGKTKRDILFCSSVLNLAELVALRPDLAAIPKKIVYFHENQLVYPVQKVQDRDFQYGYNQVTTALTADLVLFNSQFNLDSFINNLSSFFKIQPDFRPSIETMKQKISAKAQVLYFPVHLPAFREQQPDISGFCDRSSSNKPLHIVWPHRWEHDKNPQCLFKCLFQLKEADIKFKISILGETFQDVPEIFQVAKEVLKKEIVHFGRLESKDDYFRVLTAEADVVLSTANHEFFGVAMLEAASAGCLPLVPDRLVYPEIYPRDPCIYRTDQQLYKRLRDLCQRPHLAAHQWTKELSVSSCAKFAQQSLRPQYMALFNLTA
jgi:glycosyltransferase involved in cell wall biosynthesis